MNKILKVATTSVFAAALAMSSFAAQTGTAPAPATTKAPKAAATPAATPAEIADAKTKGLVWVNTSSKKYHSADGTHYGTTAHGKFMTKDDADKAGYKAAQEQGAKKAKAPKTTAAATPSK
jgi:hypothetical protein